MAKTIIQIRTETNIYFTTKSDVTLEPYHMFVCILLRITADMKRGPYKIVKQQVIP